MIAPAWQPANRPAWKHLAGRSARRLLAWRYRHYRPGSSPAHRVHAAGLRLDVGPGVFDPGPHFTSAFLARYLGRPGVVPRGGRVLDVGTGSGIAAIAAARAGAGTVVAVDINPAAVACARANARRYGLEARLEVREGDLFGPLAGARFDLIVCNPPYFRGTPRTLAERAYYGGEGYEWLDCFAAGVPAHLRLGGRALVVLGDAGDIPAILSHLASSGCRLQEVARRDIWIEMLHVFEMHPGAP